MRKTWNIEREFEVRFDDLKLRHRTLEFGSTLEIGKFAIDDRRCAVANWLSEFEREGSLVWAGDREEARGEDRERTRGHSTIV